MKVDVLELDVLKNRHYGTTAIQRHDAELIQNLF